MRVFVFFVFFVFFLIIGGNFDFARGNDEDAISSDEVGKDEYVHDSKKKTAMMNEDFKVEEENEPNHQQYQHERGHTKTKNIVCNSDWSNIEPSVEEVFRKFIPFIPENIAADGTTSTSSSSNSNSRKNNEDLSDLPKKLFNAAGVWSGLSIKKLATFRLPLKTWISDGVFTFESTSLVRDVELVQYNYYSVNKICQNFASFPFRANFFCKCWSEDEGNHHININDADCASKRISLVGVGSAAFTYKVDPFRTACVSFNLADINEDPNTKYVTYNTVIPMFFSSSNIGGWLDSISSTFKSFGVPVDDIFYVDSILDAERKHAILSFFDKVLSFLPSYIVFFFLGLLVLHDTENLASSTWFQYLLAASFGVLLALAACVLFIYR